jgi:aryl-alcohol dehydrogenase-like predicted oxidoreductase
MRYRVLGKTNLRVSEIGFGAWGIGGPAMAGTTPIGWGNWDPETSRRAIERAVDLSINFFDTADFYGLGKSEELLGQTLGKRWRDLILATKVGHTLSNDGSIVMNYSREHIQKACEESLRRLKKETIDVYQLHSAQLKDLERGDCLEAMERLKEQGKIRFWGLSLNTYDPHREGLWMIKHQVGDTLQLVLNIFNQRALKNVIPQAAQQGYGLIARMPCNSACWRARLRPRLVSIRPTIAACVFLLHCWQKALNTYNASLPTLRNLAFHSMLLH